MSPLPLTPPSDDDYRPGVGGVLYPEETPRTQVQEPAVAHDQVESPQKQSIIDEQPQTERSQVVVNVGPASQPSPLLENLAAGTYSAFCYLMMPWQHTVAELKLLLNARASQEALVEWQAAALQPLAPLLHQLLLHLRYIQDLPADVRPSGPVDDVQCLQPLAHALADSVMLLMLTPADLDALAKLPLIADSFVSSMMEIPRIQAHIKAMREQTGMRWN